MRLPAPKLAVSILLTTVSVTRFVSVDGSYSGVGIAASGTFITVDTPDVDGGYLITAITGTRDGESITALQPTGTPIPGNKR